MAIIVSGCKLVKILRESTTKSVALGDTIRKMVLAVLTLSFCFLAMSVLWVLSVLVADDLDLQMARAGHELHDEDGRTCGIDA